MLGYNRTITRTNINVLINIGPGAGGGRKRRGKKGNLPNTFDDDCIALETDNTKKDVKHTDAFKILQRIEEYLAVN